MSKKRILIFSTNYLPHIGGAEIAIKELTDRIHAYTFELITARLNPDLPKQEKIGNVLVHRVGIGHPIDKFLLPLLGTVKTFSILRHRPVHLFWGMMITFASGVPYIINILRFWNKIPIVLTLQEGDSETHINKKSFGIIGFLWRLVMLPTLLLPKTKNTTISQGMIQFAWRLALPRTKALTTISTYLKDRAKHYGYTRDVTVIPNGVSLDLFGQKILKKDSSTLRKELDFVPTDTVLITTSRLSKKNAIGDVIAALPLLLKNVKFLVIGTGELEEDLKEQTRALNLQERVVFLGSKPNAELPHYLAAADIFIRPSLSEGQGISFIEAMAAGIPVIATPVGGIVDFLYDPQHNPDTPPTGIFCEPSNPESIAQAVEKLTTNPEVQKTIIKNARTLVQKHYDWNTLTPQMQEVFQHAESPQEVSLPQQSPFHSGL